MIMMMMMVNVTYLVPHLLLLVHLTGLQKMFESMKQGDPFSLEKKRRRLSSMNTTSRPKQEVLHSESQPEEVSKESYFSAAAGCSVAEAAWGSCSGDAAQGENFCNGWL